MAKKEKKGSTKMVSPMYESGRTNGPVAGPKGGTSPKDPLGYLSNKGYAAPGNSPASVNHGEAAK